MQEAYGYKGEAGKPRDNLELRGNHYGALCKRRKVNEGRLENLVGELQSIVEVARESWKTTTGSPNHVVEGVG